MNIKTHRLCLLCFSFLALLACAAHAQETGEGAGDRLSKLRTDEQSMEQVSAKLQEDIRNVESMDDANRPRHVVIIAGQHLLEGYALMTREKYERRIAAMLRLGEMTPQQAQQHQRDTLAKTRTFPQEARKILTQIGQKLAVTKRELRALSAGSGDVADTPDSRPSAGMTSATQADSPTGSGGTIKVVSGTYGANCKQAEGNVTNHLAAACDGKGQCNYVIDFREIGDPAYGCAKNYVAKWRCGDDPRVHSVEAAPEAGVGGAVVLSCGQQDSAANSSGVENSQTNEARWGPINDQVSLNGKTLTFHSVTSVEECQADCDKNPQCVAFSLFKAEFNADNTPQCFLMSEVTSSNPSTCCISAIKKQ